MKTIWFSVNEELERFPIEIMDQVSVHRTCEQEDISKKCAKKCFYDQFYNGTTYTFPIVIRLYETKKSSLLATFNVELEYEPEFYPYKIVDK